MVLQVEAAKQAGASPTDGHLTAVSSCLKETTILILVCETFTNVM